jgi:hypothetical protein
MTSRIHLGALDCGIPIQPIDFIDFDTDQKNAADSTIFNTPFQDHWREKEVPMVCQYDLHTLYCQIEEFIHPSDR